MEALTLFNAPRTNRLALSADDKERLATQRTRVLEYMLSHGDWRTLAQIARVAGCSESSASARLRDFRKPQYGRYIVDREAVKGTRGLFVYRVRR